MMPRKVGPKVSNVVVGTALKPYQINENICFIFMPVIGEACCKATLQDKRAHSNQLCVGVYAILLETWES